MARLDHPHTGANIGTDAAPADSSLLHLVEALPEAVLLLDPQWRITYANRAACAISRILPEHINSLTFWELYPESLGTAAEEAYHDVMLMRRRRTLDDFFYEPFQIWLTIHVIPMPDGGIALYYQDITSTHLAETSLRSTTEQLQEVLTTTQDGVLSLDREYRLTYLNPAGHKILAPAGPVVGTILWESFPYASDPSLPYVEHYRRAMDDRIESGFEAFYPEPLNLWLEVVARPARDGIIVFFRDITQHKLREEKLRASEERYRVLTELSPQGLWTADPEGRVVYANQRLLDYVGQDAMLRLGDESLSRLDRWFDSWFDPEDRERAQAAWNRSAATGDDFSLDARLIRGSDGASRWWRLQAAPIRNEEGRITQWLGTASDVHVERRNNVLQREQFAEIDRQRRELEAIYKGSPVGMALYEPLDLRLLRINDRQAEIFRMAPADAIGKVYQELTAGVPAAHELIRRAASGENVLNQNIEGRLDRLPREYRYWNVSYTPIFDEVGRVRAVAAATIETTAQKRAEAALVESEKLAIVGRMASSIAHEINNPLESVTNLIYIAHQTSSESEVQHLLDLADRELRRVSIITNQTLRFHKQASAPRPISCLDLFSTVMSLYEGRLRNSGIVLEKRKRAERTVSCFEGDIRQVLNNLVSNAIEAMPFGGRLLLRSREGTDWRTGRRCMVLTVADTGTGMSPEVRANIFKAFYTTKGINGTGLGLWIIAEIVSRHDGRLLFRSSDHPGHRGTVFNLLLPFTVELPAGVSTLIQ